MLSCRVFCCDVLGGVRFPVACYFVVCVSGWGGLCCRAVSCAVICCNVSDWVGEVGLRAVSCAVL